MWRSRCLARKGRDSIGTAAVGCHYSFQPDYPGQEDGTEAREGEKRCEKTDTYGERNEELGENGLIRVKERY